MAKPTFQEQVFKVREEAIVAAVNRLLAERGFDLMTVDAVAEEVGIGKASLYKHFASKEDLAAAAMAFVLEGALAHAAELVSNPNLDDHERLRAIATWAVERQIRGEMPSLPAQNPTLRATLVRHKVYLDRLTRLSDQLGLWIESARAAGRMDLAFPPELTLYTLFAKGCDPVVFLLKESGLYSDVQIVEWAVQACFTGLSGRASRATIPPKPARNRSR